VLNYVLIHFLDHDFKCLIFVTTAVVMEIEVQKFDMLFQITFIDLPHVFLCNSHFSCRFVSQEVDDINWSICLDDVVDVETECFFCHFRVARNCNIFQYALLLPKNRYGATNLNMTEHKLVID
jgi:hypothetical protein